MSGPIRDFIGLDNRTIVVVLGIDGSVPPRDIQQSLETSVEDEVNRLMDRPAGSASVNLSINEHPTEEQKDKIGHPVIYIQHFDIYAKTDEVEPELAQEAESKVRRKVEELGFNVSGTHTVVA